MYKNYFSVFYYKITLIIYNISKFEMTTFILRKSCFRNEDMPSK